MKLSLAFRIPDFTVLCLFTVSNGRREKEETCEELVREVEGNGVFSQLSLEVRKHYTFHSFDIHFPPSTLISKPVDLPIFTVTNLPATIKLC